MSDDEKNHESEHEKEEKKVEVSIDGKDRKIRPGDYSLPALKDALKVDASKVLEELIDGQFVEVKGTAPIDIQGGEIFSSHVPRGGSSWN